MLLPLFTSYPDGSITGLPSIRTPSVDTIILDTKSMRAIKKKDGSLKIIFKKL